jgi:dihydroxyacetone kinase-like predicted kinase
MGDSLLVVGDGQVNHVHIHTEEPQEVLAFAQTIGPVSHTKVQDMREQRQDLLTYESSTPAIAIVAVVSGHGMERVYRSLGAHRLIPGGATMNPSVEQIVDAIESAPAENVIVLPNNSNIIPGARRALEMTAKQAEVVPTKAMTEGIAALLAMDPDADLTVNAKGMADAAHTVRTVGITWATRDVTWGEIHAKAGQAIAVIGDDLLAAGDDPVSVSDAALQKSDLISAEVVTLYAGADAALDEAEQLSGSACPKSSQISRSSWSKAASRTIAISSPSNNRSGITYDRPHCYGQHC